MRRLLKFVLVTGIILAGRTLMATEIPEHDPHTLIVKFADHIDGKALARSLAETKVAKIAVLQSLAAAGVADLRPLFSIPPRGLERQGLYDSLEMGQFFVAELNYSALAKNVRPLLTGCAGIQHVEFNTVIDILDRNVMPNDYWYSLNQWNLPLIGMEKAWDMTTGSIDVVVGVIDDGIDLFQPDLVNRIVYNQVELNGQAGIDDDLNGFIDDFAGWDFGDDDNDPNPLTSHGTHVAGIIGAEANNSIGIAGMDWNCWIFPIRVFNSTTEAAYVTDIISGIEYGVLMGCRILNMSVGGPPDIYEESYRTALAWAKGNGVFVIAAMGNGNKESSFLPAISGHVLAVGATNAADFRWVDNDSSGSDFGAHIDVVAPGKDIYSTVPCPSCPVGFYDHMTGTSMAAPHVSGLAALILSARPGLSVDSLYYYIIAGAEDQVGDPAEDTPGWDKYYGWGRINAYNSLMLAMGQDPTGILESPEAAVPTEFSLYQNYPNPFNASTVISFETQAAGPVKLEIFNILGQRVFVRDLNMQSPGPHTVPWNGLDQAGKSVPSGIYFYRVSADGLSQSRKMVLLK